MRIGIDARELSGHPTGVGRYLHGLLAAWTTSTRADRHEFVLYGPAPPPRPFDPARFQFRAVEGSPGTWWEQVRLPAALGRDRVDILLSPAYTTPLYRRMRAIVVIHDVSFCAHPEWFGVREGLRRRWFTAQSAAGARAIVTDSHFSKREIAERLGVTHTKIHVIAPGIVSPASRAAARTAPVVLYVGSIFNRRQVPLLVQAFAALAREHDGATLDIVGDNRSHPYQDIRAAIAREQLERRARWRQYVPEEELGELYGRARAFAFLSEYEGFGLTPLEALAAGVPPVVLDTEVARETCGDAALYVPRGDVTAVKEALVRALFDEQARARVLAAAPAVLSRYNWSRAGDDLLTVLEQHA